MYKKLQKSLKCDGIANYAMMKIQHYLVEGCPEKLTEPHLVICMKDKYIYFYCILIKPIISFFLSVCFL